MATSSLETCLRRSLFGNRARLNAYESAVMEAVKPMLSISQRTALCRRIEEINLVRRFDGGREVDCYQMSRGKIKLEPTYRLIEDAGEKELARFHIDGPSGTKNSGKIWLVDGIFFSIEFELPTEHAHSNLIRSISVQLTL